ncbi:MAG: hypothetical protein ACI8WB_000704 [Phenylobacterium sp.]|jgi:hypothetical protein
MSTITEDLAEVVVAADELTTQITGKIAAIDQRVIQFNTDATNVVASVTDQLTRAHMGFADPRHVLTITAEDDAGLLVKQAYEDGAKHVEVNWINDGLDRHWNTHVFMPVGATINIQGQISSVLDNGGNVRTDRACYALGKRNGTSENASVMIFKNLTPSDLTYPYNVYTKVADSTSLIQMEGNNIIYFGNGTYLHDQGGMCAYAYGNGLIRVGAYGYGMPNYIVGGGHHTQFYLSGPFVNNSGGVSLLNIHLQMCDFQKVGNDGPPLEADKGFKRLLDKGVAGVTTDLLTAQPYTITDAQAALNNNESDHYSTYWFTALRGLDAESDRPRMITNTTFSHKAGVIWAQFRGGIGAMSMSGLETVGSTGIYIGNI